MRSACLRLALVAASLGAGGCVETAPGLPEPQLAQGAQSYRVTVGPASMSVGGATTTGALDGVRPGPSSTLDGWAPAEAGELVVITGSDFEVVSQRRFRRPDAAAALGAPERADLGFRLVLRSDDPVERACVLFRASAGGSAPVVLAGSDRSLCP